MRIPGSLANLELADPPQEVPSPPSTSKPRPKTEIDPSRATDVGCIANAIEMVLIFKRMVFLEAGATIEPELRPTASVVVPWVLAKRIRDLLSEQIANHEARHGAILNQDGERPN